jgi:triosephosphate isomerase
MTTRKRLMAGNWKMYKTPVEVPAFFDAFLPLVASCEMDILVCPPFISIPAAIEAVRGSRVAVGGQDLHWGTEGAFTGEISGPMLWAAGCSAVLIGHSERRQLFHETNETVLWRTQGALAASLTPIVCLGECLDEREAGKTDAVLAEQFGTGIAPLSPEEFARVVIAYEPVWAIGTGKVATPEQAAEAHACLRKLISERYGAAQADRTRILYGGSVKPDNTAGLMAMPGIDGALVGGASLDPVSFAKIVNS